MESCGCEVSGVETKAQRRVLMIALWLNAVMFVVQIGSGLVAHSTSLMADGLDMLADALAYAIALFAIDRSDRFKANVAGMSGMLLMMMGASVALDTVLPFMSGEEQPEGHLMMISAALGLVAKIIILRLLSTQVLEEVHMRANWIFTRADVVANLAVILAGLGVMLTGIQMIDLIVGLAIGLYVIRQSVTILVNARAARRA